MNTIIGQAGKTVEAFAIVPRDVVEGVAEYALDQIRRAANRHYIATHSAEIDEKCEKITACDIWKDGKGNALTESTREDILLSMRGALVESVLKYYDPKPNAPATPLTYGAIAAKLTGMKETAIAFDRMKHLGSLDVPIEGGKAGSHEITHADVVSGDSDLLPQNYRGARQIRTTADLHFIRELMGNGVDWRIFSLRWKYQLADEALARALGWTIAKLRWHLKGYERRYARLLGVRSSRHRT